MSVEVQSFNKIRDIIELNTPNDIYNEWMGTNDQLSLSESGSSSEIFLHVTELLSLDALQSTISELYSIIDNMILTGKQCSLTRRQMEKIHRKIYRCVMFYYDVPSTYYVKTELKTSLRRHQLASYVQQLEHEGSCVFVSLTNCGIHVGYIENPAFPRNILSQLNDQLFRHLMAYLQALQNIFSVLSGATISKQLVNRTYTAPTSEKVAQVRTELIRIYELLKETERSISKHRHLDSTKWTILNTSISKIDSLTPLLTEISTEFQSLSPRQSVLKTFRSAHCELTAAKNSFVRLDFSTSIKRMKSFSKQMASALDAMQHSFQN